MVWWHIAIKAPSGQIAPGRVNSLARTGQGSQRAHADQADPCPLPPFPFHSPSWTPHPAVQAALRNHHFDSLGLPRLYVPYPA